MASIKDALEETLQDGFAWLKYVLYTLPVFFVVYVISEGKNIPQFHIIVLLTLVLLVGFMLKCTYNVRMGDRGVLPSFNVLSVLWLGLRGTIALAPMGLIAYFGSIKMIEIIGRYIPVSWVYYLLVVSICVLLTSLVFTCYILFSKEFKILDAYNLKLIYKHSGDVLMAVLWMFVLVAIVAAVIAAPVTYLIWVFLGFNNPIMLFMWSMIGVLCVAISGHYLAQVDYEIMPHDDSDTMLL